MILQRLTEFAERLDSTPPMYQKTRVRWLVDLDPEGNLVGDGFIPLSSGESRGKDRGKEMLVPNLVRSSGVRAKLLADNADYVFGVGDDPKIAERHTAFRELVGRCAEATGEASVMAVSRFLDGEKAPPARAEDGDIFTFRVGGVFPVDIPSVRRFWASETRDSKGSVMQCLICGKVKPVEQSLPVKIKGVPGGQTSGTALISANAEAFESYGLSGSLTSPTCRECGEAFANAINHMIATEHHRLRVGPVVFIFWTREEGGFSPASILSQPQEEDVRRLIGSYRTGQKAVVNSGDFFALSLSGSGGRAVVRDWLETTVPAAEAHLGRWFGLQKLVDLDGSDGRPYGIYALAASLYLKPNDQMVANVPRTMVRCALHGGPLPDWLLSQAVNRNRAEQGVTRNRAALIKAVMLSQLQEYEEDYMEKLELSNTSPGYLCGRLLAELEAAQKVAVRPKATLVDRYYGAASSAPATVFGYLMRDFQAAHMAKLRKNRPGIYTAIDSRVQDILQALGEFPKTLNVREQAMFSLGYYHQKAANRADARARAELKELEAEEDAE